MFFCRHYSVYPDTIANKRFTRNISHSVVKSNWPAHEIMSLSMLIALKNMHGSRGVGAEGHWKVIKIKGFLEMLVRILWKITKLPSQYSILCHHRPASETPVNGVSLAGRWWPSLPSTKNKNNKKKKKRCQSLNPLTKLSGSAHVILHIKNASLWMKVNCDAFLRS